MNELKDHLTTNGYKLCFPLMFNNYLPILTHSDNTMCFTTEGLQQVQDQGFYVLIQCNILSPINSNVYLNSND